MGKNKLIIAAAGSGKTTYLVKEALRHTGKKVLILTYTLSNAASISDAIFKEVDCIPKHLTVQTWFTFLIQHGVRPYQGSLHDSLFTQDIRGMLLVDEQSAVRCKTDTHPVIWKEDPHFSKHYFTEDNKIYSDKISKFVVKCNEASDGAVIERLTQIYDCIFIDEVQDLASYDLEILKLLFRSSATILLVGDPRQVTYLTHNGRKHRKYKDGNLKAFITEELGRNVKCQIDETTLSVSHRNNERICILSSRLCSDFTETFPCECCREEEIDHEGVFLIKRAEVDAYLERHGDVTQLRWDLNKGNPSVNAPVMNFGESKGRTFNRVLIFPTNPMERWVANNESQLAYGARSKFYVALTRARHSATIVMDYDDTRDYEGVEKYVIEKE